MSTDGSPQASCLLGQPGHPLNEVLLLIQQGSITRAQEILRPYVESRKPQRDLHLLLGVCASSVTYKFLALQAAERELAAFPDNQQAAQLREFSLRANMDDRVPRSPSELKISFITSYPSSSDSLEPLLQSLRWQHYEPFELIVVVNFSSRTVEAEKLAALDSRVKVVHALGQSMVQSLNAGLAVATGQIIGILPSPLVIWSDLGLVKMAQVFQQVPEVSFLTSERAAFDKLGIPFLLRHPIPNWSQKLASNPNNTQRPVLKIPPHATLWRASLMNMCGGHLDESVPEAYDYELFMRLFEKAELLTAATAVAASGDKICDGSEVLSARYQAEVYLVCARYRRKAGFVVRDLSHPPIKFASPFDPKHVEPSLPHAKEWKPSLQIHIPTKTKITVVTPSFNQAQYIEMTIDSVLSQRGIELEYFILDGGSSDGSVEIIRRHEKFLTSWSSQPDGGQYHAIQEGLGRATGHVMTWINSDDILVPNALKLVADLFSSDPNIRWLTGRIGAIANDGKLELSKEASVYDGTSYIAGRFDEPWIQQEGTFWRRDLWEQAGGALDLSWSLASDLELWVRFFCLDALYSVDSHLALYREHEHRRSIGGRAQYFREAELITQRARDLITRKLLAAPLPPKPLIKL